jgi:hypothetical protein
VAINPFGMVGQIHRNRFHRMVGRYPFGCPSIGIVRRILCAILAAQQRHRQPHLNTCVRLLFLTALVVARVGGWHRVVVMATRTAHPPAGMDTVIVFLTKPAWGFLLYPTLFGAVVLMLVTLFYLNATRAAKYPKYG